jgi:hypothetical protein
MKILGKLVLAALGPLKVEFGEVSGEQPTYRRFAGTGLAADQNTAQRTKFVLGLVPVSLP